MLFGSCMTLQLTNYPHMTPLALGKFLNDPPPPSQIIVMPDISNVSTLKKNCFYKLAYFTLQDHNSRQVLAMNGIFSSEKERFITNLNTSQKNLRSISYVHVFLFNNQPTPFSFIFFSGPLLKPVFFAFQPTTLPS